MVEDLEEGNVRVSEFVLAKPPSETIYLAPEVIKTPSNVTSQADVYSFGVV